MFSHAVILVFKTVVVTKTLVSGIFLLTSPIFSLNCFYMCRIDLRKVVPSEILFSKLLAFVFNVFNFLFLTTLLSTRSLISLKFIETVLFSIYQRLNYFCYSN